MIRTSNLLFGIVDFVDIPKKQNGVQLSIIIHFVYQQFVYYCKNIGTPGY